MNQDKEFLLDNIPESFTRCSRFCVWKLEQINERVTKVLYQPQSVCDHARTNDPTTFSSFDKAREAWRKYEQFWGIGVHISKESTAGISAIDIDHCIDDDGVITNEALEIVRLMDSYTERSPSGHGLRILFKAGEFFYNRDRYYIMNHPRGLEVYVSGVTNKFVSLTGNILLKGNNIEEIKSVQLATLLERYMIKSKPQQPQRDVNKRPTLSLDIPDDDLIDKACDKSSKFARLWNGDLSDYQTMDKDGKTHVDHSAGDLALCGLLFWWTNGDRPRVERLFYHSKLYRAKWERDDYRRSTLDQAESSFNGCGYNPQGYLKRSDSCSESDEVIF